MTDKLHLDDLRAIQPDLAVTIINEAVEREVYDGSASDDESYNVDVAGQLVQMALDEWQSSAQAELKGEIGDDVKALLGLAGVYPDDDGELQVDSAPDPVSPDEQDEMEEPWESYDSDTAKDVVIALQKLHKEGALDDEGKEYVRRYEQHRKNRSTILAELDLEPVEPVGEDDASQEAQDASDRDQRGETVRVAVVVDGVSAMWDWDDVVKHVVENGNKNLEVKDPAKKAALESLLDDDKDAEEKETQEREEAARDEEQEHKPLAGVREAAQQARERFVEKIRSERLPEPPEPDFDEPVLPDDPSALGEERLHRLYLQFGALLSRANWLLGLAHVDQAYCERVMKRKRAQAFIDNKDETPVQAREAKVELDPQVVEWTDLHGEAEEDVKGLTKLASAYQGNVDRLSRIGGFRKDEEGRSRQ